ncbi:MAG: hypothetical protein V7L27_30960 [Nostoc sp.]|uniref:hypothetical protein n=1 Tax=Nostoc sp. TaxID=1180 RepID=UPI002FF961FB
MFILKLAFLASILDMMQPPWSIRLFYSSVSKERINSLITSVAGLPVIEQCFLKNLNTFVGSTCAFSRCRTIGSSSGVKIVKLLSGNTFMLIEVAD